MGVPGIVVGRSERDRAVTGCSRGVHLPATQAVVQASDAGLRQPPNGSASRSAASGPHAPRAYRSTAGGASSNGWTIRHISSTIRWLGNSETFPTNASPSNRSYGSGLSLTCSRNETSRWIGSAESVVASFTRTPTLAPASRPIRIDTWLWCFTSADFVPIRIGGGRRNRASTSVRVIGSPLPARIRNGTPDQRQLSTSSFSAAYVSVSDPG